MSESKKRLEARAHYVKQVVNNSKKTTKAVAKLANELFLTERTIYNDLKK